MLNYQEIYNKVFEEKGEYNCSEANKFPEKFKFVLDFLEGEDKQVLDIGCGAGMHLELLKSNGYKAVGVEVSDVCCNKFLKKFNYKNTDIVSFANTKKKPFNSVICIDFLEHIHEDDLHEVLTAIKSVSKRVLFGIANHSDKINNVELHLIRQNADWWVNKLSEYFNNVKLIEQIINNRFFFIETSEVDSEQKGLESQDTEDSSSVLGKEQEAIVPEVYDSSIVCETES